MQHNAIQHSSFAMNTSTMKNILFLVWLKLCILNYIVMCFCDFHPLCVEGMDKVKTPQTTPSKMIRNLNHLLCDMD